MPSTLKEFALICVAVILTNLIIAGLKWLIASKTKSASATFRFTSPVDAIVADLGKILGNVRSRLNNDWKTSAFPMKINIGDHSGQCYADQDELIRIISALLEKEGWVVTKTPACGQDEIIVDLPRKKF